MSKIINAVDILYDVSGCIQCIFMATNELENEQADPIQTVANVTIEKINDAIAILEEYLGGPDASPVPAAAGAESVSPAARTTRRRK